jgi:hypothetical protein
MANLKPTDAVIVELFDNLLTQRNDDRYGRVLNIASMNIGTQYSGGGVLLKEVKTIMLNYILVV